MRNNIVVRAVLLAVIVVSACAAADITGKGKATFEGGGPGGGDAGDMVFTFRQEGIKLTGSISGGPGGEGMNITEGKVEGNNVSFVISMSDMRVLHEGVISGNEIKLKVKGAPGGDGPESMLITLKKT